MPHRITRREFNRTAAGIAAAAAGLPLLGGEPPAVATGKRSLRVGLVGCGGRGTGALDQHLKAAKILNDALGLGLEVKVTALADWFRGKAVELGKKHGTSEDRCFGGPTAYKELLATDVDIVLLATPTAFRPVHFEAAVAAGKHVFMEKPAAVDPPGVRRIIAAGEAAKAKNLMVVAGTQRRHEKGYIETQAAVAEGAIGKVLGGRVSWCQGGGRRRAISPKSPDDLIRSWYSWMQLSGDHIVEQHVHNLDIMNWFLGTHPAAAAGFGGRARRNNGNQYDFFNVDFEFPGKVHVHSLCRQVNGCWEWVGEHLVGEKGMTGCSGGLRPKASPVPAEIPQMGGGHQQEHINLLYYLAKGTILNEARNVAWATAAAIMGRTSAYTGKRIEWRDMFEDPAKDKDLYDLTVRPTAEEFEKGGFDLPTENVVPLAGTDR
jgi:myo-inositol 2-dehydrogenase/D-chiro-inositol 1-dehydrogenase